MSSTMVPLLPTTTASTKSGGMEAGFWAACDTHRTGERGFDLPAVAEAESAIKGTRRRDPNAECRSGIDVGTVGFFLRQGL